jgi:hypothetical protein
LLQIHSNTNGNDKNFNITDIIERITKESTSPKHSITYEITSGRVHPTRCPRGVKTCINSKELDHCCNQLSFNQFVIKHIINTLALSKAIEKFVREENIGKKQRRTTVRWQNHLPM